MPRNMDALLAKILASGGFANSGRLQELLRHIVAESLDDSKPPVKAATIAYDVYGRDVAADRRGESIVRVDVSRLRRKLELYYLTDGAGDDMRVEIPKGSYVPIYHQQEILTASGNETPTTTGSFKRNFGQMLMIPPFANNDQSRAEVDFVENLHDDLIVAMTRYPRLQVMLRPNSDENSATQPGLNAVGEANEERYLLEGRVRFDAADVHVSFKLRRNQSTQNVWSDRYRAPRPDDGLADTKLLVAIVNDLDSALLKSAQYHAREKAQADRDHWDHHFVALWYRSQRDIASLKAAITCLETAIAMDDQFTVAYAALVETYRLYVIADVNSDLSAFAAPALAAAKRAIETGPDSWVAHRALGIALTMNKQHVAAVEELKFAVEGNPNSAVSYFYLASAEMYDSQIEAAIADFLTSLRLHPMDLYMSLVTGRLSLCYLVDKQYATAEKWAARALRAPYPLWPSYMVRTAALGHLRDSAAGAARQELQERWPEMTCNKVADRFSLMRRSDIEHVIEGLALAGLPE